MKEALFRTRKRILKYLILGFLKQEGYVNTADTFVEEAAVTSEFQLCDNKDLDIILQDFCSYYLIRFNKQPLFCRKVEEPPVKRPQTRKTRPEHIVEKVEPESDLPATFTVTRLLKENLISQANIPSTEMKPLSGLLSNISQEKKNIAELLYQDIINPKGVSWNDVKGLESA